MDGLLIDSEPFWASAEKEVFGAAGLVLSDEMCFETRGLRIAEVAQYWMRRFPLTHDEEAIVAKIEKKVVEQISIHGRPLPGVHQTLELLKAASYTIGLASSSPLPIINAVTAKLAIDSYLSVSLSAADVQYGKPHPMIYLECAARLGAAPSECIAFEDSINGIISSKAASFFSIAVPDAQHLHNPKYKIADLVLPSLSDFTLEMLNDQ